MPHVKCGVPTASSSAALGPIPEKRTMQPSGTAPRIGSTTLPVAKIHALFRSIVDDESQINR